MYLYKESKLSQKCYPKFHGNNLKSQSIKNKLNIDNSGFGTLA